jgi:hypothetical protein
VAASVAGASVAASVGASVAAEVSVGASVAGAAVSVGADVAAGASVCGDPQDDNKPTIKTNKAIFTYVDFILLSTPQKDLTTKYTSCRKENLKPLVFLCARCGKTLD